MDAEPESGEGRLGVSAAPGEAAIGGVSESRGRRDEPRVWDAAAPLGHVGLPKETLIRMWVNW